MNDSTQIDSDEKAIAPPDMTRRLAMGSLIAGAALLPAMTARAACTPVPTYTNFKNVKADYCAKGDGVTDDTVAIQTAVNSGESLYFPPGTYIISDTIVLPNVFDILYTGSGKGKTIIYQTASGKDAFSHSYTYCRISWRDMSIKGANSSRHGINVSGVMYLCDFTEMSFYMGGSGVYAITQPVFSSLFTRCDFSSYAAHGIEIQGGPTCTFLQCYAMNLSGSKYGYRVYGQALMLGCNGIDSGGGWGLFGASTSDGDSVDLKYMLTCINCNIEDHTIEGIRLKWNGSANIINSTFLARTSGTYDSHLRIDYCDQLIELVNCNFATRGATLSAGRSRSISSPNSAMIKAVGCNVSDYQSGSYIINLATDTVGYFQYLSLGTVLNSLMTNTLAINGPAINTGALGSTGLVLGNTTASNVANGSVSPPTQVAGYLSAYLNGAPIRIPYYTAS